MSSTLNGCCSSPFQLAGWKVFFLTIFEEWEQGRCASGPVTPIA